MQHIIFRGLNVAALYKGTMADEAIRMKLKVFMSF